MDSLWQTSSVSEYLERFEQLSHGILQYNTHYDDTYFVTRFLGGLSEEIRSAIALHGPKDVAEASSLALLQEEEVAKSKKKFVLKESFRNKTNTSERFKTVPEEKQEATKHKTDRPDHPDKLKELMQYRRKNGLCFKCGEKWGHNHTCPAQIPLHVIEEVWDALQPEEARSEPSEDETEDYDVLMAVSSNTQSDLSKRKTMRLHGTV